MGGRRVHRRSSPAVVAVVAVVLAACSGEAADEAGPPTPPPGEPAMRLTIELAPDAVWDDGTPISAADFRCTADAARGTPGALTTAGYDEIVDVREGATASDVVVDFAVPYAGYRTLFGRLLAAHRIDDCDDVSAAMVDELPFSGGDWRVDSWSPTGARLVPNEARSDRPAFDEIVLVPASDRDSEVLALRSGDVDAIAPAYAPGLVDVLAGGGVEVRAGGVSGYETLLLQVDHGPFADATFRRAFVMSIDRTAFIDQVYAPSAEGVTVDDCGPVVPGPYCEDGFPEIHDPDFAARLLTDDGWQRSGDGLWQAPDGHVPTVRWVVDGRNATRTSGQDFLGAQLRAAGFDVVTDNCDSTCLLRRLPALDYDLTTIARDAPGDPGALTAQFACDEIPTASSGGAGFNTQGWCDEQATALLHEADATVDATRRTELVRQAVRRIADADVMVPLVLIPRLLAWRTDAVGGTVTDEPLDGAAYPDLAGWTDADDDGRLVIGVEDFPECLNPVTECSATPSYDWFVGSQVLPGVWAPSGEGYETTDLVTAEPEVEPL